MFVILFLNRKKGNRWMGTIRQQEVYYKFQHFNCQFVMILLENTHTPKVELSLFFLLQIWIKTKKHFTFRHIQFWPIHFYITYSLYRYCGVVDIDKANVTYLFWGLDWSKQCSNVLISWFTLVLITIET